MALQAKFPHIRIDEKIWDDPQILALPPSAFRVYIFAIAWSKNQHGRVPDGVLTEHGCYRIGASKEDLQSLISAKRLKPIEDGSYEIVKYQDWQTTFSEEEATRSSMSEKGKLGAAARWAKVEYPAVEEGFDADAAFKSCWVEWPAPTAERYREKYQPAYDAFRLAITNTNDFNSFCAALDARVRSYKNDRQSKDERRWSLGSFRTFCAERWRDWIPKSHKLETPAVETEVVVAAPPTPTGEPPKAFVDEY